MTKSLSFHLFGQAHITLDTQPITAIKSDKELALLIYLVCTEKPHPRETLAELFWPNRPLKQAQSNLRTALSRLKRQVVDFLEIDRQQVAFRADVPHTIHVVREDCCALFPSPAKICPIRIGAI